MSQAVASSRIASSAGAAVVSQLWRVAVTFGVALALRRLIPPADYGLWDWCFAVFTLAGGLRDLGLAAHVIRLRPPPFGNLLQVQLVWGGVLAVALAAGAPLLAFAWQEGDPRLVLVLQALALYLLLEGLAQVPLVFFESELAIGRSLPAEIARNATFALVAVVAAFQGAGLWSLVAGHLAGVFVFGLMLWVRAWGKIPLVKLAGQSLSMVRESLPLGAIWLLTLALRQLDPFLLGARFDGEVVGMYTFAFWLALLVSTVLIHPIGRALYPALVALGDDRRRPFEAYGLASLALLAVEVPAALFLFVNAEFAVRVFGGGQWLETPHFLRVLCFVPLLDPLGRFAGQLLASRRQERLWIAAALLTLASWTGLGLWLTGWLGPVGMAWAHFLPLGAALSSWAVYHFDPARCRRLLGDVAFLYAVPLPLFAAAALVPLGDGWWRLAASLAAGLATAAIYTWRFGHAFRSFFRGEAAA